MSRLIFENYSGSYQLRIENAEDLENIQLLDDARWAATSVPISSLNCDSVFLSYVDTDKNGRIRTDELKNAQGWLFHLLANRRRLSESSDVLILDDIDTGHPEGKKILAAARRILANLNLPEGREISLDKVRDVKSIMANAASNGDGIIPPDAAFDPDLTQFIDSVMETVGSTLDASGKAGICEKQVKIFFEEAKAYLDWKEKGKIPAGKKVANIMPWGKETPLAFELLTVIEEKIDQYFFQCAMVRFDERLAAQIRLRERELEKLDFSDKSMAEAYLKNAPLALPDPKGILYLDKVINPLYRDDLFRFEEKVLKRALGRLIKQLTEKQWQKVKSVFAPYRDWLKSKTGSQVEKLDEDKLRSYLQGTYRQRIDKLIAKDQSIAENLSQIHNLEKLILYQRWLIELTNNFVSFAHLYNPERRVLFEMGTLVIDGRQMTFTMKVLNREAHKKIAEKSFMYLLYLEIIAREDEDIKYEVVAAVTAGNVGRLHIGKRGIFFTTDGKEWDAEVVDIIENPISIWESVKAPFQQFTGFFKKQVEKFNQAHQTKIEKSLTQASPSGITRDLLLGGGLAIAALGSALAYITKALSQVKFVHILSMLGVIVAVLILPGMVIGFIKIRKRDMSVLLEASGWAVNAHLRLNAVLGRLFTHQPGLPRGARRRRRDVVARFAKKFGYSSLASRKLFLMVLIILSILTLVFFVFQYKEQSIFILNLN